MLSANGPDGVPEDGRVAAKTGVGPFPRLLFAFIGILTANAALLLYMLWNAMLLRAMLLKAHEGEPAHAIPQAWDIFSIYAIFSLIGWALVGLPIALAFPARILSRLPWLPCLFIGATLGPIALLLIFVMIFGLRGQISTFSLAHTESFWPLSIVVSTVSFGVYAALMRRRLRGKEQ